MAPRVLAVLLATFRRCHARNLTLTSLAEALPGTEVLVLCTTPECVRCERVMREWSLLEADFESSEFVRVYSLDCSLAESADVCQQLGVQSFPFIAYGEAETLDALLLYPEGRSTLYEAIQQFAEDNVVFCEPEDRQFCTDDDLQHLRGFERASTSDLEDDVQRWGAQFQELRRNFGRRVRQHAQLFRQIRGQRAILQGKELNKENKADLDESDQELLENDVLQQQATVEGSEKRWKDGKQVIDKQREELNTDIRETGYLLAKRVLARRLLRRHDFSEL